MCFFWESMYFKCLCFQHRHQELFWNVFMKILFCCSLSIMSLIYWWNFTGESWNGFFLLQVANDKSIKHQLIDLEYFSPCRTTIAEQFCMPWSLQRHDPCCAWGQRLYFWCQIDQNVNTKITSNSTLAHNDGIFWILKWWGIQSCVGENAYRAPP